MWRRERGLEERRLGGANRKQGHPAEHFKKKQNFLVTLVSHQPLPPRVHANCVIGMNRLSFSLLAWLSFADLGFGAASQAVTVVKPRTYDLAYSPACTAAATTCPAKKDLADLHCLSDASVKGCNYTLTGLFAKEVSADFVLVGAKAVFAALIPTDLTDGPWNLTQLKIIPSELNAQKACLAAMELRRTTDATGTFTAGQNDQAAAGFTNESDVTSLTFKSAQPMPLKGPGKFVQFYIQSSDADCGASARYSVIATLVRKQVVPVRKLAQTALKAMPFSLLQTDFRLTNLSSNPNCRRLKVCAENAVLKDQPLLDCMNNLNGCNYTLTGVLTQDVAATEVPSEHSGRSVFAVTLPSLTTFTNMGLNVSVSSISWTTTDDKCVEELGGKLNQTVTTTEIFTSADSDSELAGYTTDLKKQVVTATPSGNALLSNLKDFTQLYYLPKTTQCDPKTKGYKTNVTLTATSVIPPSSLIVFGSDIHYSVALTKSDCLTANEFTTACPNPMKKTEVENCLKKLGNCGYKWKVASKDQVVKKKDVVPYFGRHVLAAIVEDFPLVPPELGKITSNIEFVFTGNHAECTPINEPLWVTALTSLTLNDSKTHYYMEAMNKSEDSTAAHVAFKMRRPRTQGGTLQLYAFVPASCLVDFDYTFKMSFEGERPVPGKFVLSPTLSGKTTFDTPGCPDKPCSEQPIPAKELAACWKNCDPKTVITEFDLDEVAAAEAVGQKYMGVGISRLAQIAPPMALSISGESHAFDFSLTKLVFTTTDAVDKKCLSGQLMMSDQLDTNGSFIIDGKRDVPIIKNVKIGANKAEFILPSILLSMSRLPQTTPFVLYFLPTEESCLAKDFTAVATFTAHKETGRTTFTVVADKCDTALKQSLSQMCISEVTDLDSLVKCVWSFRLDGYGAKDICTLKISMTHTEKRTKSITSTKTDAPKLEIPPELLDNEWLNQTLTVVSGSFGLATQCTPDTGKATVAGTEAKISGKGDFKFDTPPHAAGVELNGCESSAAEKSATTLVLAAEIKPNQELAIDDDNDKNNNSNLHLPSSPGSAGAFFSFSLFFVGLFTIL